MKFDYVIGNPPYQLDSNGESKYRPPVYHLFMDAAYNIADKVELITPGKFLFNAGDTPKSWNKKMLNDEHFKVLSYNDDPKTVFPNTIIKGGVSITYRDANKSFGAIKHYTTASEIQTIMEKIEKIIDKGSISDIINVASKFNINNLALDFPEYAKRERRLSSNVLTLDCFHDSKQIDDICIYGVIGPTRKKRFINKKYIDVSSENIFKYKVILPKADGNGKFGEIVTNPEVLEIDTGYTHTFYGIGSFENDYEAKNCLKYTKTKFARACLSILKVTQNVNAATWKYVPLQDFTEKSDIDWTKSIHEIDEQLYKKYNLSQKEIDFIENNVKEME